MTKVLYIEDNDDNVYMLKMRLELLGDFEVLTAEDGEKGCEVAAAEQPDIILMDLEMPVVDGWEATGGSRAIRKPATSRSSFCPRTRWRASAKRRLPLGVTSSTARRSNSIGWSRPCGVFSRTASEAFHRGCAPAKSRSRLRGLLWVLLESRRARLVPGSPHLSVISKGWITTFTGGWHPSDSEQLRSVPRTQPTFGGTVDPSTAAYR